MFETKVVEKTKTHILGSVRFLRKSYRLLDTMEKCGTARESTKDSTMERMRFACWITETTYRHLNCVIPIVLHDNSGSANAPQYYVIPISRVLFIA
jgi:hypothetical protein